MFFYYLYKNIRIRYILKILCVKVLKLTYKIFKHLSKIIFRIIKKHKEKSNICLTFFCLYDIIATNKKWE